MKNDLRIAQLRNTRDLPDAALKEILNSDAWDEELRAQADEVRRERYGTDVYIRGLIEFTNFCKNNCLYCGIRAGNERAQRYRLSQEEILECCREGYVLGYRTFVLQGGEDPFFTDERVCEIVSAIHAEFPQCAITLSIGEKSRESYQAFYDAGARRYLLRHETATEAHYEKLHPRQLRLADRQRCLWDLKQIGYQVGSGFMVGSPWQTTENLVADLRFLQQLQPDMIGIGPFISHRETPLADFENGELQLTLRLVSILRLMFPYALIPATTALGSIHPEGRELGLQAGANVVMPNLSPMRVRKMYALYDGKISTGEESAQSRKLLEQRVNAAGYRIVTAVGNVQRDDALSM